MTRFNSNVGVHLVYRWERMGWDVFVCDFRPGTTNLARVVDGELVFDQPHPEGTRLPEIPTFFLPEIALKALVDKAVEKLPADGALSDHLKDAKEVRDRVLAMLEKAWP